MINLLINDEETKTLFLWMNTGGIHGIIWVVGGFKTNFVSKKTFLNFTFLSWNNTLTTHKEIILEYC